MNQAVFGNATVIEILWTLFTVAGMCLTTLCCGLALGDLLVAYQSRRNGYSRLTSEDALWDKVTLVVQQSGYVMVGVLAMITPPPILHEVTVAEQITAAIFLLAEMAIIVNCARSLWVRKTLYTMPDA